MIRQQLGTFVLNSMAGARYNGDRTRVTPGEVNDLQNPVGGMQKIPNHVLEVAIGFGKALGR